MRSINYFSIVLAAVVLSAFSTSVQAQQVPFSPFAGITQAQQIFGPKISPDQLRGKVVIVEYWGTRCGPCRQSMPHLQEMYSKLGDSGLFCIIGNHVQQYTADTDSFLKKTGVTFPVYQQLNLPINQPITSIPHAFVYDATGRLVADGHPMTVVNIIPSLIQQASQMKRAEILHAMNTSRAQNVRTPQIANSSAGRFDNSSVAMISPGQPWQAKYNYMKNEQFNKILEPQKQSNSQNASQNSESGRLIELAKTNPAKAYIVLVRLNRSTKDSSQDPALADVFKTLSADKNVKALSIILVKIADLESKEKQMTQEEAKARAQSLFLSLKSYYYGNKLSPELKKETCDAARKLKQKYGCSGKKTVIVKADIKVKNN